MLDRLMSEMRAGLSRGAAGGASRGLRGGAVMGLMLEAEKAIALGLPTRRRSAQAISVGWDEGWAGKGCRRGLPTGLARWYAGALSPGRIGLRERGKRAGVSIGSWRGCSRG